VFRLVKPLLPLLLAALVCAGCARHKSGGAGSQPTTQTIAPADAQPAPNGTDPMTQTVEVDDSRSESDGMTTATTTTPARGKAPAKAPSKKKGKK
jgi:hypothetical protein